MTPDDATASLRKSLAEHVPKAFTRGTHRISPPEETLARVRPLACRMGITRLGNITGLDLIGIPVTVAVRPNARSVSVSAGKGLTLPQAFASALMEAVELFHAEKIDERTRLASFADLSASAPVLDPKTLCGSGPPLPDRTKIAWIEGYDLLNREPCWAPWDVVHTNFTLPVTHASAHFRAGSNGLAAGNHLLEGLSSALCELVERDAVALWHSRRITQRAMCRLDLGSVDDEHCCALLARYAAAGIAPKVWDVTSDIGLAAFICDIPAAHGNPDLGLRRFRGSGCHPDRAVALARALTEAAQVRLTYVAGIRDDIPLADYEETAAEKLGAALLDAASEAGEPRSFSDVPHVCSDDLASDVQWALQRLRAAGLDRVIAVDLSRADIGVPVVRVVVPDLEWDCSQRSYAPGPRARRARGLVQ